MFGLPHPIQPNLPSLPSLPLCLKGLLPASLTVHLSYLSPGSMASTFSPLFCSVWSGDYCPGHFLLGRGAHHGRWWTMFHSDTELGCVCPTSGSLFLIPPISSHQNPPCPPKPVLRQPLTLPMRIGTLGRCVWPCHCLGTPQPQRLAEIWAPVLSVPSGREGAACGCMAGAEPRSGPALVLLLPPQPRSTVALSTL